MGHNNLHKASKMVKIRLRRTGAKKKPSYRLVVADARAPRDGAFINIIGHYNPLTNPETIVIDEEKALYWLRQSRYYGKIQNNQGENMRELVEFIAKSIVNSPDDVVVTEETDEQGVILKLQVADDDKGRVIGKQGRIAAAMRTLIRVKAAKAGTRATLEIV